METGASVVSCARRAAFPGSTAKNDLILSYFPSKNIMLSELDELDSSAGWVPYFQVSK